MSTEVNENFSIKVSDFVEHEDGSATLNIEMDNVTKETLLEFAFIELLKKSIAVEEESDEE